MSGEAAQTSLKTIGKGWEVEVSVNMETVPLNIYQETKDDRRTVCWIPSVAGKNYSVTMAAKRNGVLEDPFYGRLEATILIDGQTCHTCWVGEKPYTVGETRLDPSRVRQWCFSQPRLEEEGGPTNGSIKAAQDLGAIVIEIRRSRLGPAVTTNRYIIPQDTGSISEKTKKGILGAVTTFVEKQSTLSELRTMRASISQPEDYKTPIWTFRFNYAPEAVLQAQGRIPIKHNISQGEAGLNATEPIDLDNEPGPSSRSTKEKKPKTAATTDENEPDAEEAALLAALEGHRAKKRKQSSTFVELSDDDSDSKAAITRHMGKQLKIKKEKDGGKVDLTLDSD